MRYVSIAMLAAHTGKAVKTVLRALKLTKTPMEKLNGSLGYRITEKDANRFLLKQWPDKGPLPSCLSNS